MSAPLLARPPYTLAHRVPAPSPPAVPGARGAERGGPLTPHLMPGQGAAALQRRAGPGHGPGRRSPTARCHKSRHSVTAQSPKPHRSDPEELTDHDRHDTDR